MSPLSGQRVLVLEDDYYVADDIREALETVGAVILGPAATVDGGMQMLTDREPPDLAVLDVNLRGTKVYGIAEILAGIGIPFLFATGYDRRDLPTRFDEIPTLTKPYAVMSLVEMLEELIYAARVPP